MFGKVCLFTALLGLNVGMGTGQKPPEKPEQPFVKCWEFEQSGRLSTAPVTDNGTVFLAEAGGLVRAVSSETGQTEWSIELGGAVVSDLLLVGDNLYLATTPTGDSDASILRILDAKSGIVRKTASISAAEQIWLSMAQGGVIAAADDGLVVMHSPDLNSVSWSVRLDGPLSTGPSGVNGRLAVALENGRVILLDTENGSVDMDHQLSAPAIAILAAGIDAVVAGDSAGNLFRIGPSGTAWTLKAGAAISYILNTDGKSIIAASLDNFIYSIDPESGRVVWRKRTQGRITHRPAATVRNVFTAAVGEPEVLVSDTKGRIVNRIVLGEGNYVIDAPAISAGGSVIISMPGSVAAFSNTACSPAK
jgi:outer membrane protein assembly factor BamB